MACEHPPCLELAPVHPVLVVGPLLGIWGQNTPPWSPPPGTSAPQPLVPFSLLVPSPGLPLEEVHGGQWGGGWGKGLSLSSQSTSHLGACGIWLRWYRGRDQGDRSILAATAAQYLALSWHTAGQLSVIIRGNE